MANNDNTINRRNGGTLTNNVMKRCRRDGIHSEEMKATTTLIYGKNNRGTCARAFNGKRDNAEGFNERSDGVDEWTRDI